MKKLLEGELVSIAHRILRLKGREDIDALLKEAQLVTQKLAILKFYEDHKSVVETEISQKEFEKNFIEFSLESSGENLMTNKELDVFEAEKTPHSEDITKETFPDQENYTTFPCGDNNIINIDETTEIKLNDPKKDLTVEVFQDRADDNIDLLAKSTLSSIVENLEEKQLSELFVSADETSTASNLSIVEVNGDDEENSQISSQKLEDLFQDFSMFDFVRTEKNEKNISTDETANSDIINDTIEVSEELSDSPLATKSEIDFENIFKSNSDRSLEAKTYSLNDKLTGGVKIGLNDKIGFIKHLFDGSEEDFSRVVSQLNTFNSYQEAFDFVENIVKPDYGNWENKEDYSVRFFSILERSY